MSNKSGKVIGIWPNHMIVRNNKDNLFYVFELLTQEDYDFFLDVRLDREAEYEMEVIKGEFDGTYKEYKETLSPEEWLDYGPQEIEDLALNQAYHLNFWYIDLVETLTFDELKERQAEYC